MYTPVLFFGFMVRIQKLMDVHYRSSISTCSFLQNEIIHDNLIITDRTTPHESKMFLSVTKMCDWSVSCLHMIDQNDKLFDLFS